MQKVSNAKTATAYAEAWFEAAKDNNAEDATFNEVKALLEGIEGVALLWSKVASPIEDEKDVLEVFETLTKKTKLSLITTQAINLIIQNKRLKLMPLILKEFITLYYQNKGIVVVEVESAVKITDDLDKKLTSVLEKKLKSPIVLNHIINPKVLGGLKVKFNSYEIDDTVQSKLEQIRRLLLK